MHALSSGAAAIAVLSATSVLADPIPPPVAAMIDAAASDPATLKTVADLAKKTNPGSVAEIDARVAKITADAAAARTEKLANQGLLDGWSGEGELGLVDSTGNTTRTGATMGVKLAREGLRWKHTVTANVDYEREDGVTSKKHYFAGYDVNYRLSPRLYALGLVNYESDRFAGYDRRFNEGVGLGYDVVKRPDFTLSLEGGPALRQTRLVAGEDSSSFSGRTAVNLLWRLTPGVTLTDLTSYYFGGETNTLTSDTALTAKLFGALSARLSFYVQSESNPVPGRAATDTTSRLTLVYEFKGR